MTGQPVLVIVVKATDYHFPCAVIELCDSDPALIPRLSDLIQNGKLAASSRFDEALGKSFVEMHSLATSMVVELEQEKSPAQPSTFWGKVLSLRRRYMQSEHSRSSLKQFRVITGMINKKIYRNRMAVYISAVHHVLCGVMIGLIFYAAGNDGDRMFDHLKFCIGVVFFLSYTQVIIPVLNCECRSQFPVPCLNLHPFQTPRR